MKLKYPPQPLVFYFSGVSPLCGGVTKMFSILPETRACLCLYREKYLLAVHCGLAERARVRCAVGEYGFCLGACCVMYSFFEEHGRSISTNAIKELGAALCRGKN